MLRMLAMSMIAFAILVSGLAQAEQPGIKRVFDDQAYRCEVDLMGRVRPFLYHVEKDGEESYILGTRHIGVPLSAYPEIVRDVIDAASSVTTEVPKVGRLHKLWLGFKAAKSAMILSGPLLSQQISPEAWAILKEAVAAKKYPDGLLNRMSPMAAYTVLMNMDSVKSEMAKGQLDEEIRQRASSNGVSTRGFEAPSFQLNALQQVFSAKNLEDLLISGKYKESARDLNGEKFLKGDEADLFAAAEKWKTEPEDVYNLLLRDRNLAWIPQIEATHAQPGMHFFAFGAAHLYGEHGIIPLLRARGFTVTRVTE